MKKSLIIAMPVVLGVVGVAAWVFAFYILLGTMNRTGVPLSAPGLTTVTITNAGDYTIWNQTKGLVDGQFKTFSETPPPGIVMKVTRQSDGAQIALSTAMRSSMDRNGTRKVSLASLTIDSPGEYQVNISGMSEKRALFLEHSRVKESVTFCLFLFAGFFFLALAFAAGVFALIQLFSNKKRTA